MAVGQSVRLQLTHRHREQAPSHFLTVLTLLGLRIQIYP
ncbi:hypothetical protein C4K03_3898 [Pseudomonas synxantha]|uniref:Uncharacterized protein n=1 Tax=Pseudomonas synxantha TaxID=47883 RepID=A0A3G7U9L2_9PSED|nr:hypothetical protein C4K03_3898 [Pseudomonas synxantha]